MKALSGLETGLRAGVLIPPAMRNTVLMDCRMYGRHPNSASRDLRFQHNRKDRQSEYARRGNPENPIIP